MALRTHDVVIADGTFRIVLTPRRRVIAVLDAPQTMLGPLHVALQIDREPFLAPGVSPLVLAEPSHATAGLFDDIGHAISHAAEGAFNAASHVATTVARPAFDVLKTAAGQGANLISHTIPMPAAARRELEAAGRTIMRARLGDLTAKQFIQGVASAAKAGVGSAMKIGDTLLDASKLIARAADAPVMLASHVPVLGDVVKAVSPLEVWDHMATAIQHGDFKKLADIARQELSLAQGVIAMVPGVGTGISSAISAGLAILNGGSPLEIALRAAYGAIPIPPGLRQATDTALDSALALAMHGPITDVGIQVARDRVPAGLPRDVFDTLVHLVVHKQPVRRVGGELAAHFVRQYAPAGAGVDLATALHHASSHLPLALPLASSRMVQPLMHAVHA
jgi:hypothetical protein